MTRPDTVLYTSKTSQEQEPVFDKAKTLTCPQIMNMSTESSPRFIEDNIFPSIYRGQKLVFDLSRTKTCPRFIEDKFLY